MKNLIISLACTLLFPQLLFASTFHIIMLSTFNDSEIIAGEKKNIERLNNTLLAIAKMRKMSYKTYSLVGKEIKCESIDSLIQKIKINKNDIVFFYYSGHGINDGQSLWPKFLTGKKWKKSTSLLEIAQKLSNKKPKLLFCTADCCNYLPGKNTTVSNHTETNNSIPNFKIPNIWDSKGIIIATSSQVGQLSYGKHSVGGIFTLALSAALVYQKMGTLKSYQDFSNFVVNETKQKAEHNGHLQIPQIQFFTSIYPPKILNNEDSHIVQKGETLYQICQKYNMAIDDIMSINNLTDTKIKTGLVLIIAKSENAELLR